MASASAVPPADRRRRVTPVAVPPAQQARVNQIARLLTGLVNGHRQHRPACKLVGPKGETLTLPASVFDVLERATAVLARGDAVSVVPVGQELTTQQAAALLNVSRQYLVRLLDAGRIPCRKTGAHRRLRVQDVLIFKEQRERGRQAALRHLTWLTEDFGGYDRELK